jgi:hypothetical protein
MTTFDLEAALTDPTAVPAGVLALAEKRRVS